MSYGVQSLQTISVPSATFIRWRTETEQLREELAKAKAEIDHWRELALKPAVFTRATQDGDIESAAHAVATCIAAQHGYTLDQLRGRRRNPAINKARWEATVSVHDALPEWSLIRLGRFFHRDHTAILRILRKAGRR